MTPNRPPNLTAEQMAQLKTDPDHVKRAEMARFSVRLANALGLLLPIAWDRSMPPAHRQIVLREKTRGLVTHDMTLNGEANRLKARLDSMKAAAMANASVLPRSKFRPRVPAPLNQK
jgi:hypothetical protein